MATHYGNANKTVKDYEHEVFNHMEHNYPRSWGVLDIQYLLDVIKEKDEVIRQLSSGDYFVHY